MRQKQKAIDSTNIYSWKAAHDLEGKERSKNLNLKLTQLKKRFACLQTSDFVEL